jgi:hypothetical protein
MIKKGTGFMRFVRQSRDGQKQKKNFSKMFFALPRKWGLATKLEHIRNSGKK